MNCMPKHDKGKKGNGKAWNLELNTRRKWEVGGGRWERESGSGKTGSVFTIGNTAKRLS